MGKLFGIVLIVVGIWVGMTVYSEGSERAFGGIFAGLGGADGDGEAAPLERMGQRATEARDAQMERYERQLGEAPPLDD